MRKIRRVGKVLPRGISRGNEIARTQKKNLSLSGNEVAERMKLIVDNRTHWKTSDVRQFIMRALRFERPELFAKQCSDYTLRCDVEYHDAADDPSCSGQTHIEVGSIWFRLPRETVDKVDLAIVCFHEAAHSRGLDHDSMTGDPRYDRVGNWRELYAWANDLPLEKRKPRMKRRSGTDIAGGIPHSGRTGRA